MPYQILVIEKENSLRRNLVSHLRSETYEVLETDSAEKAFQILSSTQIHLVLIGLEELKRDGIGIMKEIRERFPHIKIITINSGERLELSIEAMRLGAFDDFLIPFDLDGLLARIDHAIENKSSKSKTSSD